MHSYNGHCQCGLITIQLDLPRFLNTYQPRKCDCDFCVQRNIAYLSDNKGLMRVKTKSALISYHQGSEQAEFYACKSCDTVMLVAVEDNNREVGAVNAIVLGKAFELQSPVVVSPKKLAPKQKLERWREIWMPIIFEEKE